LVNIGHVVFEISEQTDKETNKQTNTIFGIPPGVEVGLIKLI